MHKSKSKWWKSSLVLAAGAAVALPAFAQNTSPSASGLSPFYIGGNVGMNTDNETGFGLFGGYQWTRNFGAEIGYQDTGQSDISGHSIDSNAWELVGVGKWPIANRIDIYGKLGFYQGHVEGEGQQHNNTDLTYGFGAQYNVNERLGLRVGWQRYNDLGSGAFGSSGIDLDMWSLAATYRFR